MFAALALFTTLTMLAALALLAVLAALSALALLAVLAALAALATLATLTALALFSALASLAALTALTVFVMGHGFLSFSCQMSSGRSSPKTEALDEPALCLAKLFDDPQSRGRGPILCSVRPPHQKCCLAHRNDLRRKLRDETSSSSRVS